jgi:DNA-directed RNA polymerase subunit RPC12/RpoP
MATKKVMREIEVGVCDICGKEITDEDEDTLADCVVCGKEVCENDTGETTDDGILCKICNKKYEFDTDEDGEQMSIVVDIKTRKEIDTPYM